MASALQDAHGAAAHHIEWLAQQLQSGQSLCVDGQVLGLARPQLRTALQAKGVQLRTDLDLLAEVWEPPGLPRRARL